VAIAATTVPFRGNFVPIYYFIGYAYGATVIPLINNPATGFAGASTCETPSVPFQATCLGAMGILSDGIACAPQTEIPGACCFVGGTCQLVVNQTACEGLGGSWNGAGTCDPSPCPVTWACCIHDEATGDETCLNLTQAECAQSGGLWHQSSDCGAFTCPLIRACCIETSCTLLTQEECLTVYQGNWHVDKFSCAPETVPCPEVHPVEPSSWGSIKAIYR
jgi:hypothetical protein